MTANVLTVNSSKTEFLFIGLKNNLPKCTTLHSTLPTVLAVSALSLINSSPFQTNFISLQSLLLSYYSSIALYPTLLRFLSSLCPVPLPPLLFTPNLITSTL